jgi:hypothetical protein
MRTQPCWCSVIRGVERLAPRMDRLAPILRLELDMNPNDEDLEALPRATLCARVRGLLYHLWPLGERDWQVPTSLMFGYIVHCCEGHQP